MAEVLRTDLGHVRLASLLQLAEGELFTGRLACHAGSIGLREGEVVAAECGALRGVEALRELFLVAGGPVWLARGSEQGNPLGGTLGLVMEGCRIADEWDRLAPMVLLDEGGEAEDGLGPVLAALDGRRSLYEVLRALSLPAAPIIDPVLRRLDEGLLVEVAEPRADEVRAWMSFSAPSGPTPAPEPARAPAAAPELPEDYESALEAGRRSLRQGEYDRAEAAFRAALVARPGDRIATQNLRRVHVLRDEGSGSAVRRPRL